MLHTFKDLSPDIHDLVTAFRDGLVDTLGEDLVGAYLLGSIAFPGFEPHVADIDFHAVVRRPLDPTQQAALAQLHQALIQQFRYGARLDGFYIPMEKAKGSRIPTDLVSTANGKLRQGARDDAWALHREHLHRGGYIALFGPDPREIYAPPSKKEVEQELEHELDYVRKRLKDAPFFAALNLCRLIYTWETGRVAVSKHESAEWALMALPVEWHDLIQAAVRSYQGKQSPRDKQSLRDQIHEFFNYAEQRIVAARQKKGTDSTN